MSATLTALELKVYDALVDDALGNGGDFGLLDTVDYKALGLTAQQFGGLVTSLQAKRKITVYPITVNGSEKLSQFTIDEDA